jgi:hypothetical protein
VECAPLADLVQSLILVAYLVSLVAAGFTTHLLMVASLNLVNASGAKAENIQTPGRQRVKIV